MVAPKKLLIGEKEACTITFKGNTTYNKMLPAILIQNKSFQWSSNNSSIASISSKGVVTAKKAGTVTITAKLKNGTKISKSMKITVSN